MQTARAFISLAAADRAALARWLSGPAAGRVEAAIDLTPRPWNVQGAHAVIGLFEPGRQAASWLVVNSRSGWMVADCATGHVRGVGRTLAQALALA
jgi:hypothetical protein